MVTEQSADHSVWFVAQTSKVDTIPATPHVTGLTVDKAWTFWVPSLVSCTAVDFLLLGAWNSTLACSKSGRIITQVTSAICMLSSATLQNASSLNRCDIIYLFRIPPHSAWSISSVTSLSRILQLLLLFLLLRVDRLEVLLDELKF